MILDEKFNSLDFAFNLAFCLISFRNNLILYQYDLPGRSISVKTQTKSAKKQPEELGKGAKMGSHGTDDKLENCVYCGKSFTHKEMIRHKAEEEKILKCRYCDQDFDTLQLFRRHTYRYHKYYFCKICNLKFLKGAYEYHMSSVHRSRPECTICNKSFATKLSLIAHEKKIHLGQRDERFQCNVCHYKAPDRFQYKIHIARHNKSPSLVCDHCGAGHYTKGELNKHIQADHCGGYLCEFCHKSFRSPEYLKRHKHVHEPGYDPSKVNFTCEECGKGFLNETRFKRHSLRHRGQMPTFECDACGKRLTSKSSFNSHLRMHSGNKPFVCSDCGKAFSDKRYLTEHKRHHTGEKPFYCDTCGQRFSQYGSLSTHKKGHNKT